MFNEPTSSGMAVACIIWPLGTCTLSNPTSEGPSAAEPAHSVGHASGFAKRMDHQYESVGGLDSSKHPTVENQGFSANLDTFCGNRKACVLSKSKFSTSAQFPSISQARELFAADVCKFAILKCFWAFYNLLYSSECDIATKEGHGVSMWS